MRVSIAIALVTLLTGSAGCFSAEPPAPRAQVRLPAEIPTSVLIRNTAVLDVESGSVAHARDVLLRDGVIAAIEPVGSLTADRIIDGAGATLVPGLIDMHGHVSSDSSPTWARGFPDPEAMRASLDRRGWKLAVWSAAFAVGENLEIARKRGFLAPGSDLILDLTNPATRRWWIDEHAAFARRWGVSGRQ